MHLASRPTSSAPTSGELDVLDLAEKLELAGIEITYASKNVRDGISPADHIAIIRAAAQHALAVTEAYPGRNK